MMMLKNEKNEYILNIKNVTEWGVLSSCRVEYCSLGSDNLITRRRCQFKICILYIIVGLLSYTETETINCSLHLVPQLLYILTSYFTLLQ